MALTNDAKLAEKMMLFRSHGITRDPKQMTHKPDGPWYYQQIELGFNYRTTDIQAALGISQMERLNEYVFKRHQIAECYQSLLKGLPISFQEQSPEVYSAYHLFVIRLDMARISLSHSQVFESMRERGIGVNLHYIPVPTQPYYQNMGFKMGDFPESERYYAEAISLPMYPKLTCGEQDHVVEALKDSLTS